MSSEVAHDRKLLHSSVASACKLSSGRVDGLVVVIGSITIVPSSNLDLRCISLRQRSIVNDERMTGDDICA